MELLVPPRLDPGWQGWVVAEDETYQYIVVRMMFNYRMIVVRPGAYPAAWWGWCFADYESAVRSVAAWDPATQDEPLFWHKRPGWAIRKAPNRAEKPDYNRLRCLHGDYVEEGCSRSEYCPGAYEKESE